MAKRSLRQAAQFAGITKPTVLKHLKNGKISAEKDLNGRWWFDVAELVRVYGEPERETGSGTTPITSWHHPALPAETGVPALLAELRRQIAELKQEREREVGELRRMLEREQDRHARERGELIALLRDKEATSKLLAAPPGNPISARISCHVV